MKKIFNFLMTKRNFLLLFLLVYAATISAQLVITPGTQLYMSGNTQLTLQNIDLVNNSNGGLVAGNGTVSFTGNASSNISGSQPVQFYKLEINKTSGSSVLLQRAIDVTQQVSFVNGFLNLNNFDVNLGTTGTLNGEQETSRIIGSNGGQVLFSTVLNTPVAVNPANLGAIISSAQNLGAVIVRRGHRSQINNYGQGNTVLRYFDILPVNNNNLNATLRFQYFDGELNGLTESTLVLWRSADNLHWTNEGSTSKNSTINYVEKTGIASFSRWTLSSLNNPLPVAFVLFNIKCEGGKVVLNWKTAQEQNSSHYIIERSTDGLNWTMIGSLPAAGNSNIERSYLFTDNNPLQKSYYRIAQYDINGRVGYTAIQRLSCNVMDALSIWPNPFHEKVFINVSVSNGSQAVIKVFDNKGALIKIQNNPLLPGSNQLTVDMKNQPNGMYQLTIEWDNGQIKRTTKVIKQ